MTQCVSPDLPSIQFCSNEPPFWQSAVQARRGLSAAMVGHPGGREPPEPPGHSRSRRPTWPPMPRSRRRSAAIWRRAAAGAVHGHGCQCLSSAPPRVGNPTDRAQQDVRRPAHPGRYPVHQDRQASGGRGSRGCSTSTTCSTRARVLVINTRYGPSWLLPSNVLGARLFKLGAPGRLLMPCSTDCPAGLDKVCCQCDPD